jgi:hypothetical protein
MCRDGTTLHVTITRMEDDEKPLWDDEQRTPPGCSCQNLSFETAYGDTSMGSGTYDIHTETGWAILHNNEKGRGGTMTEVTDRDAG